MKDISQKVRQLIEEWDIANPAMQPLPVQHGYEAHYLYKQPVVYENDVPANLPENFTITVENGCDVVCMESLHELSIKERNRYQALLEEKGLKCAGVMRLVKQSFMLCRRTDFEH